MERRATPEAAAKLWPELMAEFTASTLASAP